MSEYLNSEINLLDDSFLYQVAQKVVCTAKKIVLASGMTLLLMAAPVQVEVMNSSEFDPSFADVILAENSLSNIEKKIVYQEPAPETIIMTSLKSHKGDMMPSDKMIAFCEVAKELGMLPSLNVVCRWSTIHKTVSTIQKLDHGLELRSTWFAERGGKDVVFTIYHLNSEIITSRTDAAYLVTQVKDMVEKSDAYV